MFVVAYLCETLEMLLDAHNKAFAFYGGVPLQSKRQFFPPRRTVE